MMVHDAHAARPASLDWLAKSAWAIVRSEAILAGSADPGEPVDPPRPRYILARLHEEHVHSAIAAILDVDDSFRPLSPDEVRDEDIQSACETVVAAMDLSDAVGNAEFHAAMAAIRSAYDRLHPD